MGKCPDYIETAVNRLNEFLPEALQVEEMDKETRRKDAFSEYSGNYGIIGGSACEVHEENAGQTPRATNTVKEKFWEGEKMFYQTQMDNLGEWIMDGKKAVETSDNPKLLSMGKTIGPERFGVVFYINTLYAKWNPWDNLDRIFEY